MKLFGAATKFFELGLAGAFGSIVTFLMIAQWDTRMCAMKEAHPGSLPSALRQAIFTSAPKPHGSLEKHLSSVIDTYADSATAPLATPEYFYFHMLNLRNAQPDRQRFGTIGDWHTQWLVYFHHTHRAWLEHTHTHIDANSLGMHGSDAGQVNAFRVCDIGFGPGFSSILFLTATTSGDPLTTNSPWQQGAAVVNFDLGLDEEKDPYTPSKKVAYPHIYRTFGTSRFTSVTGESVSTIPAFAKAHPGFKCDVIHIDGNHEKDGVLGDIQVCRDHLAKNTTTLLFDDLQFPQVMEAIRIANRSLISIDHLYSEEGFPDPLTAAQDQYRWRTKFFAKAHFRFS